MAQFFRMIFVAILAIAIAGCHSVTALPHSGKCNIPHGTRPAVGNWKEFPMRGAWVATVYNLDIAHHSDAMEFQKEFTALLDSLKAGGINAVFFQVRSWNDAFYASKLNPWSRFLTGKEGRGIPDFDPLAFAVTEAHKRGMQLHAWINPYRLVDMRDTKTKQIWLSELAENNFARLHPDCVLDIPVPSRKRRHLILDPGRIEVQKFVADSVLEIIENYQIDGIHLDDYFYPRDPVGNADSLTFQTCNPAHLEIHEWRRQNINTMIRNLSGCTRAAAKRLGRNIAFGISPFGIWANKKHNRAGSPTEEKLESFYEPIYADSRLWIQNNWIDYIAPQIYWELSDPIAPFPEVLRWWTEQVRNTNVQLFVGIAAFKQQSPNGAREIQNQLKFLTGFPEVNGILFFRARNLMLQPGK